MLRPQRNRHRDLLPLDGLWAFRADPDDRGEALGWPHGFEAEAEVAVPGSLQEQLAERGYRDYAGAVWLTARVPIPRHCAGRRLSLRFGSADLRATFWLDGALLGEHEMSFLPVAFALDGRVVPGVDALLVVRLDGRLDPAHPLPGIDVETYREERRPRDEVFPPVRYDFFPYLGLHRSPQLVTEPSLGLTSLWIETDFDPDTREGAAWIHATAAGDLELRLQLQDPRARPVASATARLRAGEERRVELRLQDAACWSPQSPTLYRLVATLHDGDDEIDAYTLDLGFRRVRVAGTTLEVNGEPTQLRGFGMHEDFPVVGKAHLPALMVKDFELLRWVGANSFRTSHYAYAEETLDMADRRGFLVISEVASVNLDFRRIDASTLARHCAMIDAQIARDRSHPSVIAWSLTNEPGYLAEAEYMSESDAYYRELFAHARSRDGSRLLTAANVGGRHGDDDPLYDHCDFLMLNRYVGWYEAPAQLDRAVTMVEAELDRLARRHGKPMLISEFGADAIAGMHASGDQLFSEEYQARFIAAYWRLIARHPAVIGGHVWNFADFRTAQHHRRVMLNHKGVFTRTRDPKLAAWTLRRLWGQGDDFAC
jgi:beta-glucuronidase